MDDRPVIKTQKEKNDKFTDEKNKLNEIFLSFIANENKEKINNLDEIDFCNLIFKAAEKDELFKICESNLCMYDLDYKDKKSVLMLFSFYKDQKNQKTVTKTMSEKILEIVNLCENVFTYLDHYNCKESKEDKLTYLIAIKNLE